MNSPSSSSANGASVAIIGLGNIGSQTVALLSGIEAIERVVLIDHDRYEPSNLGSQRISPGDVGRCKVQVQARSLRRLAPHLVIETHAQPVETMALGQLRGHVMLACVDSRIARQSINRIAFALGTPWIDAGLDRGGQVRSRTYLPGSGDCLECAWGPRDYELLEQQVPCAGTQSAGSTPEARATAAPSEYGAVAAALQVSLLRDLLSAAPKEVSGLGKQWFFDIASGRGWIGTYAPNPACRLDHARWEITDLACGAAALTLRDALALQSSSDANHTALTVEGQMFVRRLRCPRCGASRRTAGRLHTRIASRGCVHCGAAMRASATDAIDMLTACTVPSGWLDAPLSRFGLVDGDIFSLQTTDGTTHYHLSGAPQETY